MLKHELRIHYKKLRSELAADSITAKSLQISNQLLQLPIWSYSYYHLYLPVEENQEVDTRFILSLLQGRDKHVVIPKISGADRLTSFLLTDQTRLVKNKWRISEPEEGLVIAHQKVDVAFLPLLAFDLQGHRVGYGKGFYDKFLKECRKDTVKIGLAFFAAVERITDVREGDIAMDYCVTPARIYSFDGLTS